MGKKAREKRDRKAAGRAPPKRKAEVDQVGVGLTSGDLRHLPTHVKNYLAGVKEAETALRLLGRDASMTVMQIAERLENDELLEFGKRLVAMRPQVKTNLMELRLQSILDQLDRARARAAKLEDRPVFDLTLPAVAFFDPLRVADALVRGGRPRTDLVRLARGDLAWFAPGLDEVKVAVFQGAAEALSPALKLRLVVESGLVYVGPPEAADGPRMGTIRFDPFRTPFDDFVAAGHFLKVEPGRYDLWVRRGGPGEVCVTLVATESDQPLDVTIAQLSDLPG